MKNKKPLSIIASEDIEQAIGFYTRDKAGATSMDYLKVFLVVARQYGFATQDDSWGELEKELQIVFTRLERSRRYIDSNIHGMMVSGDCRDYDEIYDELMKEGEDFWKKVQAMRQAVEVFG